MIIKSMSRKTATFGALVAYVDRVNAADQRFALHHNLHAQTGTALVSEFEANGRLLKARKNGVVMYHEIISITRAKGITTDAQKEILRRIALDYLGQRAPHCLSYGKLHDDHKGHLHYHLVLSANESGVGKRHTLTRAQFRKIQVELEQRVLANYPQLEQKLTIGKTAQQKQSQAGVEMSRRGAKKSNIDALKDRARQAFAAAQNAEQLFTLLTDAGLELYSRGKAVGLRDLTRDRNHRLETLGLSGEFNTMRDRFTVATQQKQAAASQTKAPPQVTPVHTAQGQQTASPITAPVVAAQAAPPQAQAVTPTPQVPAPVPVAGLMKAAQWIGKAVKGAEKVVGTVATQGGALANQVLGGAVKHTTGMIETAVQTIGGPKAHTPTPQSNQQNAKPQASLPALDFGQATATKQTTKDRLKQNNSPVSVPEAQYPLADHYQPTTEMERIVAERLREAELKDAEQQRHGMNDGLTGPKLNL